MNFFEKLRLAMLTESATKAARAAARTAGKRTVERLALEDLTRRIVPEDKPLLVERLLAGMRADEIVLGVRLPASGEWSLEHSIALFQAVTRDKIKLCRPGRSEANTIPPEKAFEEVTVSMFNLMTGTMEEKTFKMPSPKFKIGDRVRLIQDVNANEANGGTRKIQRYERGTVLECCPCGCCELVIQMDVLPPDIAFKTHEDRVELVPAADCPQAVDGSNGLASALQAAGLTVERQADGALKVDGPTIKAGDTVVAARKIEFQAPCGPVDEGTWGEVEAVQTFADMIRVQFDGHDGLRIVGAKELKKIHGPGNRRQRSTQATNPAFCKPTQVTPPRDVRVVPADRPEGT